MLFEIPTHCFLVFGDFFQSQCSVVNSVGYRTYSLNWLNTAKNLSIFSEDCRGLHSYSHKHFEIFDSVCSFALMLPVQEVRTICRACPDSQDHQVFFSSFHFKTPFKKEGKPSIHIKTNMLSLQTTLSKHLSAPATS